MFVVQFIQLPVHEKVLDVSSSSLGNTKWECLLHSTPSFHPLESMEEQKCLYFPWFQDVLTIPSGHIEDFLTASNYGSHEVHQPSQALHVSYNWTPPPPFVKFDFDAAINKFCRRVALMGEHLVGSIRGEYSVGSI